jgi:putative tricarboxylic transport membrane protein
MAEDAKAAGSGTDEERAPRIKVSMTMDKRIELAVSVVIILLGVFIVTQARGFRTGLVQDPISPRGLPMMLGAFLILGGSIVGAVRLATWSALPGHFVPAEGRQDEEGHPASGVRALSIAAAGMIWLWLLDPLGYLIITPLYLVLILLFLKVRSWKMLIGFSVIYTVASWVIFGPVLGIRFPLGPLEPLALSLGLIT